MAMIAITPISFFIFFTATSLMSGIDKEYCGKSVPKAETPICSRKNSSNDWDIQSLLYLLFFSYRRIRSNTEHTSFYFTDLFYAPLMKVNTPMKARALFTLLFLPLKRAIPTCFHNSIYYTPAYLIKQFFRTFPIIRRDFYTVFGCSDHIELDFSIFSLV